MKVEILDIESLQCITIIVFDSPRGGSDGDILSSTSNSKTTGFIKSMISEIRKKKLQSSTSVSNPLADEIPSEPPLEQPDTCEEDASSTNMGIKWNTSPDTSDRMSSSHEQEHVSLGMRELFTCPFQNKFLFNNNYSFLAEFADDTTKFFCKVYYAEEFRRLRESIHPEGDDRYILI